MEKLRMRDASAASTDATFSGSLQIMSNGDVINFEPPNLFSPTGSNEPAPPPKCFGDELNARLGCARTSAHAA